MGFEKPQHLERELSSFPSIQILKTIGAINRLGALPILGSFVGIARLIIALSIAPIVTVALSLLYATSGQGNEFLRRVTVLSWGHALFAIAEIIPIIGTMIHSRIKSIVPEDTILGASFSLEINDGLQLPVKLWRYECGILGSKPKDQDIPADLEPEPQ